MTTKVDIYKIEVDVQGAETIGQMEAGIKQLRKELKDKKVGSEEFNQLSKEIGEAEGKLQEMTAQSQQAGKKVGGAFQSAGKTIEAGFKGAMGASMLFAGSSEESIRLMAQLQGAMQLKEGVGSLITAARASNMLTGALGGASKASRVLKLALISTGIGAIVVLLGSLVAWFSKTTEGMEAMNTAMNVVSGVIDVIIDRIVKFGGALVKFLKGDFAGGINDMKEAFSGVGEQMQENIKRAQELSKMQNQLKKDEVAFIQVKAEQNKIIAEARAVTQDETASIEDKRKALEDMREAQETLIKEEIRQQEQRIAIMKLQQEQSQNNINDDKQMAEEMAKLISLKQQDANLSRTILREEKRVNAEARAQQQERIRNMQERVNKEIELEKRRLEVLEELTETDEKRFLERRKKAGIISVEEYNIALMEVEKKWAGIRASEQEKADREAEQQRKEAEEKRLSERAEAVAKLEAQFQQERLERLQSFQRGEISTRDELDQLNEAAELDAMNRRKELLLQQGEDITAIQLDIAQKEIDIEKRKNDELIKEQERLSMARMRVLGDSFRMLGALNQGFVKDEKQRENLRKAIAVGEIATDTALAISAAVKASSQNPANAVTAGGAGAVQLAASLVKIGTNIGSAMAILRSGNVGGGIGGGGGRGAAGAMASGSVMPQFNIRETMAEQMDTRVFVVEDDIRDMTNRVDDFNRVSVID
jgi:tetrahydromethanopterin S-methyltransferase subunit G